MEEALPVGSRILDGQYCLTRLLYQRPRVNLYLGRRLAMAQQGETGVASETQKRREEPLVAIRELVLAGLPAQVQEQVEQAVREEFVSPGVVSSLHLSGTGERMWLRSQHERHYLLMQLDVGNEAHIQRLGGMHMAYTITTLADLLQQQRWPKWLDAPTAVAWGIQLCRIVARLQRLGTVLGNLDPATVLVDQHGIAPWSPLLLVCWPPSPQFWTASHKNIMQHFPVALPTFESAFAAPEVATGVYDGRADVYVLGAVLYLLLTGYAPVSAMRRLADRQTAGLELIPPRLFCSHISPALEGILLRSLTLDPAGRYDSVFALIEALEEVQESQY